MTVVGVTAGQLTVERALVATLEKYVPLYVCEAARRYAREGVFDLTPEEMEAMLESYALPFRPRGITIASKGFEDWQIDALPHIQVRSPSWEHAGGSQIGRTYRYQLQAACLVGAQDLNDTRLIRACYEDAILGVAEQHQSLGGVTAGIDEIGGGSAEYSEIVGEDEKTFQGSVVVLEATLEGVLQPYEGPQSTDAPEGTLPGEGVPPVWPADPTVGADGAEATLVPEPLD